MSPDFTLSPAVDDFYDAVFKLHESLFRPYIAQIWGWHESWQHQNFRKNWETCDTRLILAAGEVVGYRQTLLFLDHLQLKNVGLLPSHRSRGIGRMLIEGVQKDAAALGLPVCLSVFVTNPDAVDFYEHMGFTKESRTHEFQHMIWRC